jgi:hypothetical protein
LSSWAIARVEKAVVASTSPSSALHQLNFFSELCIGRSQLSFTRNREFAEFLPTFDAGNIWFVYAGITPFDLLSLPLLVR